MENSSLRRVVIYSDFNVIRKRGVRERESCLILKIRSFGKACAIDQQRLREREAFASFANQLGTMW